MAATSINLLIIILLFVTDLIVLDYNGNPILLVLYILSCYVDVLFICTGQLSYSSFKYDNAQGM